MLIASMFGCKTQPNIVTPNNQTSINEVDGDASENTYQPVESVDLVSFYTPSKLSKYTNKPDLWDNENAKRAYKQYRGFAFKSFYNSLNEGRNEIYSPLSLYYALAILANAADNNTKKEMETVLEMTVDDLNQFLYELDQNSSDNWFDTYTKANALWFNTDLGTLKQEYINTITKYYGNSINEQSFKNVRQLVSDVNNWSNEQTKGAIDNILEESDIQGDTIFLILNALAAGGQWDFMFDKNLTMYEEFYNYDGSRKLVEMMHDTRQGYWTDGKSEGFVKSTDNGLDYIAILPNNGMDVYEYLNQSTPDFFYNFANNVKYEDVVGSFKPDYMEGECPIVDRHFTNISFPKFQYKQEYDLVDMLKKIGLVNIFDYRTCDFSKMDDGSLYVQFVKQNASIELDEEKFLAAATTVIGGGKGGGDCLQVREDIYHDVVFNRPFIFAICSQRYEVPIFIGIVNELGESSENAIRIQNVIGAINIRNSPSTKGEKVGTFEKDSIVYAFETREAEGYTWYRIGENTWVADQKGQWIKRLN